MIVGAGLAGLAAAKELRHSDAEVFVVDRANHNLFQPLLALPRSISFSTIFLKSKMRNLNEIECFVEAVELKTRCATEITSIVLR